MVLVLYNGPTSLQASVVEAPSKGFVSSGRQDYAITREEYRMKELSQYREAKRAPRRSQTHHNYQIPQAPTVTLHTIHQQPRVPEKYRDDAAPASGQHQRDAGDLARQEQRATRRRPTLGQPRRSYSVMDYEPIPHHHRPSARMTLLDLPSELHFAIFDFLDPIDSTCLGLTNKHFYDIHRRMHGTISLSARRDGPNELEWAWHLAGAVIQARPPSFNPDQVAILRALGEKREERVVKATRARPGVLPEVWRHALRTSQAHPGMDGRGVRVLFHQAEIRGGSSPRREEHTAT